MIEPEDDQLATGRPAWPSQNDEQMSQQDIHSNGFDETNDPIGEIDESQPGSTSLRCRRTCLHPQPG
jgi:hypothetical protein